MASEGSADAPSGDRDDVKVVTSATGPDQYKIVVSATLEAAPAEVWSLLWDWERFLAVGLPGQTSDFKWTSGGPDEVPSSFEFSVAGTSVEEEIYERTAEETAGRYRLRYRTLAAALGILEYDALLELRGTAETRTLFSATREVRLAPGSAPDMLAGMVQSETQHLIEHFGR